jgi:hypothetical protein
MLSVECIRELQESWFPNITDRGLDRLVELLEKDSPYLIHGCFTRSVPMGCLATHAAWHHPITAHLTQDAGISWLYQVAGLNPATSFVLRDWDRRGSQNWEMRAEMLAFLKSEQRRRQGIPAEPTAHTLPTGPIECTQFALRPKSQLEALA